MPRIPIVRVGRNLIATVSEDVTDADALEFQEELNLKLEQLEVSGVLIDVTLVQTLDSFLGRLLYETALGARLLGARTVVAGIQPSVAITLVELGLELPGIQTVLTTDRGLALLARTGRSRADGR